MTRPPRRLGITPEALAKRGFLRRALGGGSALLLGGCDRIGQQRGERHALPLADAAPAFDAVVARDLAACRHGAQRLVAPRPALAQEFGPADVAVHFRANGTLVPRDADYQALMREGFKTWQLQVGGLVEQAATFTLADLRAMPSRTQITRHDCVEGWSAIGKWKGVPLAHLLAQVRPRPSARYVVFHCADSMESPGHDSKYYESVDLDDAYHAQTVLAYELNDQPLPVANGAPLRVRIERQLGYKHAKYLMRIELVESFDRIRGGAGGYWEDNGYEWYAGI